ncbi:MAG TPA: response regulator [Syntrophales bacterium]|nr:response regulator [Syntrophales bacterium]
MNTAKRTILCVDDEKDILNSLYDTFMDVYNVKTAASGVEALRIFTEEDIVLVISDQRMPEMEGTELLKKINELKPKCKKILLTGYADVNAAIDAINKGAVDKYISKPWDDDELVKTAENLIRRYENEMSFAKLIEDARSMKESVTKVKDNIKFCENFINSYLYGVCLVSPSNKIEFVNKAGLEILKCSDFAQIKGKNAEEIFLLTDSIKTFFREKYAAREQLFDNVYVKTSDGSLVTMQLSLTFDTGGSAGVIAIVFLNQKN